MASAAARSNPHAFASSHPVRRPRCVLEYWTRDTYPSTRPSIDPQTSTAHTILDSFHHTVLDSRRIQRMRGSSTTSTSPWKRRIPDGQPSNIHTKAGENTGANPPTYALKHPTVSAGCATGVMEEYTRPRSEKVIPCMSRTASPRSHISGLVR